MAPNTITNYFAPSSQKKMATTDKINEPRRTSTGPREQRQKTAKETLDAVAAGSFMLDATTYAFPPPRETRLYSPADLSHWASMPQRVLRTSPQTKITISQSTTLESASRFTHDASSSRVGILNFASATKPGGGFLSGAQAQEESIARSSNLYTSLTDDTGKVFYEIHKKDNRGCYYSHHIIWSAAVTVFRRDDGSWHVPYQVDVVTSAAVNAGVVRARGIGSADEEEKRIELVMRERMARILYVFESQGVSRLVLGSFGTGVFKNKVELVARLWAELLARPDSRFKDSFEHVVFGIIDEKTKEEFEQVFAQVSSQT